MTLGVDEMLARSFVISINDDRLQAFRRRFSRAGLTPMPAVFRGFEYRNGVYKDARVIKLGDPCNVRLSNLALVKTAQAMDWPYICIFEDDALPRVDAREALHEELAQLPDDIDLLKFGWLRAIGWKNGNGLQKARTIGSHSYIVFKRYYDQFQAHATRTFQTDGIAMSDPKRNVFCARRLIFVQDDRQIGSGSVHGTQRFLNSLSADGQLDGFEL